MTTRIKATLHNPITQIEPYIYFPLMSISEAAKYLGVSRSTIYRLIELDEIRAAKQGKAIDSDRENEFGYVQGKRQVDLRPGCYVRGSTVII